MAQTRADRDTKNATIVTRTVDTTAVTVGCMVKEGAADHQCLPCTNATTDIPIGIVVAIGGNTGVTAGAANDRVQVALLIGGIVAVKTGGTATRGQSAKYIASGGFVADAVPDYSAATAAMVWSPGYFTHSGASGDMVGLALSRHQVTEE